MSVECLIELITQPLKGAELTSSVIINANRHSLTIRKSSGSVSLFKLPSIACVRRPTSDTQSSSTSRSLRKERVVRKTSRSMIKNPVISCVREGNDVRTKGDGKIRSD